MAKGTIVLITFPFTDLSGSKLRPSVVLAESSKDVAVAFISSQTKWQEPTDLPLSPSTANALKVPSVLRTSKLATLDRTLVKGYIGSLTTGEVENLDKQLKLLLQLA